MALRLDAAEDEDGSYLLLLQLLQLLPRSSSNCSTRLHRQLQQTLPAGGQTPQKVGPVYPQPPPHKFFRAAALQQLPLLQEAVEVPHPHFRDFSSNFLQF